MTNSALTTLILQPPPIRKEMDPLPTILKANQLCPDNIDITTPTNQERDGSAANDVKSGGT